MSIVNIINRDLLVLGLYRGGDWCWFYAITTPCHAEHVGSSEKVVLDMTAHNKGIKSSVVVLTIYIFTSFQTFLMKCIK